MSEEILRRVLQMLAAAAAEIPLSAWSAIDQLRTAAREAARPKSIDPTTWAIASEALKALLLSLDNPPSADEIDRTVTTFGLIGLDPPDQEASG